MRRGKGGGKKKEGAKQSIGRHKAAKGEKDTMTGKGEVLITKQDV